MDIVTAYHSMQFIKINSGAQQCLLSPSAVPEMLPEQPGPVSNAG